jgi:uncharacterized OB-fold protein
MSERVPAFPAPPADAGVFQPFWDGAAKDLLMMPLCQSCGRAVWYPAPRCPACASEKVEWKALAGTGTLFSYTVVHRSFFPALTLSRPFVVGLVELEGAAGARLVADVDADPEHVKVGVQLRVRFDDIGGVRRPVFEPVGATASSP